MARFPHLGCSTMAATIRRTTGNTMMRVGKPTTHDTSQAFGQREPNCVMAPTVIAVDTADTTADINIESTSGMTIHPYFGESFRRAGRDWVFGILIGFVSSGWRKSMSVVRADGCIGAAILALVPRRPAG